MAYLGSNNINARLMRGSALRTSRAPMTSCGAKPWLPLHAPQGLLPRDAINVTYATQC